MRTAGLIAHALWTMLAIGVSIVLVAFGGDGHPPAIILLPFVIVLWLLGHLAMWAIVRLARAGRGDETRPAERWPAALRIALIGTGLGAGIGIVQVAFTAVLGELYPYRNPVLWTTMAGLWLAHGVCFGGLLLRRAWSRLLGGAIAAAWALLAVRQVVEHVRSADRLDVIGVGTLVAMILALLTLAVSLMTSARIRAFLARSVS